MDLTGYADEVADWAEAAMEWTAAEGQIEDEETKRNLTDTIPSQEVFTILYSCASDSVLTLAE